MKYLFWLLQVIFIFLFPLTGSSQSNKKAYNDSYKAVSLRTSLTSYLDYDAGIMLGINYRWNEHFSASFEPTWIFYNAFFTNSFDRIFPAGIKIRSDLRYHFEKNRSRSPDFFIASEFHYKYTSTELEDIFGINCQNGQCAFFQNAIYKDIKNEIGGILKFGMITNWPFVKSERWYFELYNGIGAKQLKFKESELPVGGSFINPPNRNFLSIGNQNLRNTTTRIMLPAGLKLIFILCPKLLKK
jgi:hypothetical protein